MGCLTERWLNCYQAITHTRTETHKDSIHEQQTLTDHEHTLVLRNVSFQHTTLSNYVYNAAFKWLVHSRMAVPLFSHPHVLSNTKVDV